MSTHGYVSYTHGCRCDECKAAKAAYMRNKRAAAKKRAPGGLINDKGRYVAPIENHGTATAWRDHKCRCLECSDAYHAANRSWASYNQPRKKAS